MTTVAATRATTIMTQMNGRLSVGDWTAGAFMATAGPGEWLLEGEILDECDAQRLRSGNAHRARRTPVGKE